jgi:hypothetical protein
MRGIWLILALLGGLFLARWATLEPRPVAADAPPAAFASGRAMADIRVIAAAPHPVGSAANARVRDYLIARLDRLGLTPRVQRDTAFALFDGGAVVSGADVENLIGVLPGRDRAAPALALMAHYDSAPRSPGAGDDAAGVAVALEVVRAIKARGAPARDIVVLLTDGEEPGMLGAKAFFAHDPLARHIGLVINLEARGGAGRTVMFETSRGNGGLISALRRSAVAPTANALANAVYRRMPNGTDFSLAAQAGKAGLNFAFVGGQFDYHAPTATPANLHEGAVQSMGAEVLSLARGLAFADALPARSADVAFSQAFGPVLLAYPTVWGWLVLAAILGLLGVAAARARDRLRWRDALIGAGASLFALGLAAGLLWLARAATGVPQGFIAQLPLLARFGLWEAAMALIGLAVVLSAAQATARRDMPSVWLGVLSLALLPAVGLQAVSPDVGYLVAWPLLLAALGAAACALGRDARWPARLALCLLAALSLGWLAASAHFVATGLDAPAVLAIFVWLAALSLWPLILLLPGRLGWIAAATLIVMGAAIIALLRFTDAASPRHPRAAIAYYVAEPRTGRFWLATPAPASGAWAKALLAAGTGPAQRRALAPLMARPLVAPARAVVLPAYRISLAQADDCTVSLTAPWRPDARLLNLDLTASQAARSVRVGGQSADILRSPKVPTRFALRRAEGGLAVVFRPAAPGEVTVRYALLLDRWPSDAAPPPPRAADEMAWGDSDALVLLGEARLNAKGC